MTASTDIIKEIAEQLDCGLRTYMHKTTEELLFVPDTDNYPDMDWEAWDEDLELLENHFDDYWEIEKWSTRESFEMMASFAEQLTENRLKSRLIEALNKKKPFGEFKFVIDHSDFRQQWFDFRDKKQQVFVKEQLNRLKHLDE